MTFAPTQETLEEYLRRRSLRRKTCTVALDEIFFQHGHRKKGTTESKTKPFGYGETVHMDWSLHED